MVIRSSDDTIAIQAPGRVSICQCAAAIHHEIVEDAILQFSNRLFVPGLIVDAI